MISLSPIIVSYNTREMTLRCIDALRNALAGMESEIWVVDNASKDGSAEAVRERFAGVRVIENPINAGFGAANNLAMKQATGKYLLLINSDAFVEADAVARMIRIIEQDKHIGVVGPRLLNADGSLQRSVYRFPSPGQAWLENLWLSRLLSRLGIREDYESWPHDREADVPWAIGACLLVRREVIDRVGAFDERFFMYAEEADWQKRIRDAGYRIAFTPEARVTHLGGGSGTQERAKISEHFFQSLDRYQKKHHGWLGLVCTRLAMTIGSTLRVPLWAATWLMRPHRRERAISKLRLHGWLAMRQLTHWTGFATSPALSATISGTPT
jgi:GT2 family glycosyltransferase